MPNTKNMSEPNFKGDIKFTLHQIIKKVIQCIGEL